MVQIKETEQLRIYGGIDQTGKAAQTARTVQQLADAKRLQAATLRKAYTVLRCTIERVLRNVGLKFFTYRRCEMKDHKDLDGVIRDLTELLSMIERKSNDMYITALKQYVVNPLAWLHAEKIARTADTKEQTDTAQNNACAKDTNEKI